MRRMGSVPEPRSISQEILAVLIDPNEAHRLALAGYLQAKHFTWENTAKATLETYRSVLERE